MYTDDPNIIFLRAEGMADELDEQAKQLLHPHHWSKDMQLGSASIRWLVAEVKRLRAKQKPAEPITLLSESQDQQRMFLAGYCAGIREYAWRDELGNEMVGQGQRTLDRALCDAEKEAPAKVRNLYRASPELLKACRYLLAGVDEDWAETSDEGREAIELANNAILKAEGKAD